MTTPTWAPSDEQDLLELVAKGSSTGTADREWADYLEALRAEAIAGAGLIRANALRERTRGLIYHKRAGAFCNRAVARGLVAFTGYAGTSNDKPGKNAGKPVRNLRALPALFADSP